MNRKIELTVGEQEFAEGTTPAGVRVTITGPIDTATVTLSAAPYEVAIDPSWPSGDYKVEAQAVDTSGGALGNPVESTFAIAKVKATVPLSIAVVTA